MSQITPRTTLVEANRTAQTYQGTPSRAGSAGLVARGSAPGLVVVSAVAALLKMISSECPDVGVVY
jgi:hypothetical protein